MPHTGNRGLQPWAPLGAREDGQGHPRCCGEVGAQHCPGARGGGDGMEWHGVAQGPGSALSCVLEPPTAGSPHPRPPHALLVFIALLTTALGPRLVPAKPQPRTTRPCPGAKSSRGDAKNTPNRALGSSSCPSPSSGSVSVTHSVPVPALQGGCTGCLPQAPGVCHGHGHPVPSPTLTTLTANLPCLRVLFFYL